MAISAAIVIASLLPGASLHDPRVAPYIDSNWAHFTVYLAVAALSLLVWKTAKAIAISLGTAVVSVLLQIVHGVISGRATDVHDIIVNLLGIASGILLGLNVERIRSRANPASVTDPRL